MKKTNTTLLICILIFGLFFVFHTVRAESIEEFNSTIVVNTDSSIFVEENITYDFEGAEKHGIFRIIPLKNSQNYPIEIKDISVSDDNGNQYNFTENISNNELTIKIGDADKLISGVKEYNISYKVLGAIGYYEDHDEIYWNVTGNNWIVPIKKIQTRVILPAGVTSENIENSCYIGIYGGTSTCKINVKDDGVYYIYESILNKGEGMTIATGFPTGSIVKIELQKKNNFTLQDFSYRDKKNMTILLLIIVIIVISPIFVFIYMFIVWKRKGKDPRGLSTIVAEYEPPLNMKPTMVGAVFDGKFNYNYLTAGLIYLAEQGYIKIKKLDKDYEIELIKEDISKLEIMEKDILNLFFNIIKEREVKKISDYKNDIDFPNKIKKISEDIYKKMEHDGFFEKNPRKAKMPYIITGIVLACFGLFLLPVGISGIIILIFGLFMDKRTKLGAETRDHILGFKKFLTVTEKDRLNFHNAPNKNPEQFMKFLPYAIALCVEKNGLNNLRGFIYRHHRGIKMILIVHLWQQILF